MEALAAIAKPELLYPEAMPSSSFFLKKKPPSRLSARARLPWFCSKPAGRQQQECANLNRFPFLLGKSVGE
jgi:hypothetical protein